MVKDTESAKKASEEKSSAKNTPRLHDGHRARMHQKYRQGGGEALADHELLEMLLYYSIPRMNTNETAHCLLDRFGSLSGVLNAPFHELTAIPGVGAQSAELIRLCGDLANRAEERRNSVPRKFRDLDQVGRYLVDRLDGLSRERVVLLLFSADYRLLGSHTISDGSVSEALVDVKKIIEYAVLAKATHLVLAHNHPDPMLKASAEDESLSLSLMRTCAAVGLNLWEHILVSDGDYLCILREILKRKPY